MSEWLGTSYLGGKRGEVFCEKFFISIMDIHSDIYKDSGNDDDDKDVKAGAERSRGNFKRSGRPSPIDISQAANGGAAVTPMKNGREKGLSMSVPNSPLIGEDAFESHGPMSMFEGVGDEPFSPISVKGRERTKSEDDGMEVSKVRKSSRQWRRLRHAVGATAAFRHVTPAEMRERLAKGNTPVSRLRIGTSTLIDEISKREIHEKRLQNAHEKPSSLNMQLDSGTIAWTRTRGKTRAYISNRFSNVELPNTLTMHMASSEIKDHIHTHGAHQKRVKSIKKHVSTWAEPHIVEYRRRRDRLRTQNRHLASRSVRVNVSAKPDFDNRAGIKLAFSSPPRRRTSSLHEVRSVDMPVGRPANILKMPPYSGSSLHFSSK